jgi:ribosome modulation factor
MAEKDAFAEGVDAFARGRPLEACPYPEGDERRAQWLDGWRRAKIGDELYVDGEP